LYLALVLKASHVGATPGKSTYYRNDEDKDKITTTICNTKTKIKKFLKKLKKLNKKLKKLKKKIKKN
jgi:peptidoglycan hydrolase CwlO-like protein